MENISYFLELIIYQLLQKLLSISLIFLWLLFNYSRIWSYRTCPAMPLIPIPAVTCDCERTSPQPSNATDSGQPGAERAISKPKPEETFAGGILFALNPPFKDPLACWNRCVSPDVTPGFATTLFQPPRC